MASVDFKKLHGTAEMKRILRHCDKGCRLKDGHRNKDIDKRLTHKNTQLPNLDYNKVCRAYAQRIAYLDRLKGANLRQDRVTCFALEIPAPNNMREKDKPEWFQHVFGLIADQYDARNILQFYVHYDEVHEYVHAITGQVKVSRVHAHCLVIPEHEGKLNGKWFSSRANMMKLNNAIQKMTMERFTLEFMDGSKQGSSKRVEQLKRESESRKYEMMLEEKERELKGLENKIADLNTVGDHFDEILKLGLERYKELHPSEFVEIDTSTEEYVRKIHDDDLDDMYFSKEKYEEFVKSQQQDSDDSDVS